MRLDKSSRMANLPKWKRIRPGLYRLEGPTGTGQVERGAETSTWYWITNPANRDRKRRVGAVDTMAEAKAFVDAFLEIDRP